MSDGSQTSSHTHSVELAVKKLDSLVQLQPSWWHCPLLHNSIIIITVHLNCCSYKGICTVYLLVGHRAQIASSRSVIICIKLAYTACVQCAYILKIPDQMDLCISIWQDSSTNLQLLFFLGLFNILFLLLAFVGRTELS
jgi:hypothetical protein